MKMYLVIKKGGGNKYILERGLGTKKVPKSIHI